MLKDAGAPGRSTPYGKVKSYGEEVPGDSGAEDNTDNTESKMGGDKDDSEPQSGWDAKGENYYYSDSEQAVVNKAIADSQANTDDDDDDKKPTPVNTSETKEYSGDGITLKGLYDAINGGTLQDYLDGFSSSTSTSTNSTGGTHTVTTKGLEHDISSDMTADDFYKDSDGNIIGWTTADGTPDFESRDEWYVDSNGDWFYVGTGAVGGAGGEGSATIIGADGQAKTVGPRSYADLLGFDQDLLQDAVDDRAAQVTDLTRRQDYY
ncbi:uncharacterized protein METZ01_LOCUS435795, partial [marine metagenome]